MSCKLAPELIEKIVSFHGHSCPGLTIGMRAAELAREKLGEADDAELVAVVETDMCGVDAIQYLTGCTFGKGNLVHRDYGKMAFSFFDRKRGLGFRLLLKPEIQGQMHGEMRGLMKKVLDGSASPEEQVKCKELREQMQDRYMNAPLEELFLVQEMEAVAPRRAMVLDSIPCESCGEMTMESRTRRYAGRTLCIPCFDRVEQKV